MITKHTVGDQKPLSNFVWPNGSALAIASLPLLCVLKSSVGGTADSIK